MDFNRKLLDALLELHSKSRSGILRIEKDSVKKQLVLHEGLLVFAESNLPQEHLAHIMISQNLMPRGRLNEVAVSMKAGKTSEEAIAALSGSNLENLEKGRREQAVSILSSLLGWEDCALRLYPGAGLVRSGLSLKMQLPELIITSLRRALSKRAIPVPAYFLDGSFMTVENVASPEYPLSRDEAETCALLKNGKPAAEILPLIPAKGTNPEETLLCLYYLGLISRTAGQKKQQAESGGQIDSNRLVLKLEDLLSRFESASFYEILSVSTEASQEEIQEAYHEQAKQLHPDRFQTGEFLPETRGKAEQVFARINEAYLTLKNSASRAAYDAQRPKKKAHAGPKPGVVQQTAETAEGLFREGKNLLSKGDLDTAVERLRGCVWLCPENAPYHYYLGVAESRVPKFRKSAEQHLLKSIELQDMSADSHLALAKLYIDVKLPRKAELQIEQALLWDPHNAEALKIAADLKKLR